MEKYRAIPEGYLRIGEVAKKARTTVRTLQYYDKEGLLSPSAESDGGFRLYTDKDLAKLVQILMMKELGFSLSEIKKRLTSLDTPADVVNVLTNHAADIRKKIEHLSESLNAIETLTAEITQMESVDFNKYAAIFISLQIKNEHYWMIKHFDDEMLNQFMHLTKEKAEEILKTTNGLNEEAAKFRKAGISPESEKGQTLAKEFWEAMLELANGDMDTLIKFNEQIQKIASVNKGYSENLIMTDSFIDSALEIYLSKLYKEGDA